MEHLVKKIRVILQDKCNSIKDATFVGKYEGFLKFLLIVVFLPFVISWLGIFTARYGEPTDFVYKNKGVNLNFISFDSKNVLFNDRTYNFNMASFKRVKDISGSKEIVSEIDLIGDETIKVYFQNKSDQDAIMSAIKRLHRTNIPNKKIEIISKQGE